MTENQKTKMALLFMSKGDLKNAELAYKFIMSDSEKSENMPSKEMPNGIYLIKKSGFPILFEPREPYEKGCGSEDYIAVGIKMGNKSIAVALKDAANGEEITLTEKDDKTNWDGYKDNCTDAVADMYGLSNTKHLDKIGLNKKIDLKSRSSMSSLFGASSPIAISEQYIPSVGEMYLIYLHKKALNEALRYVGGEPLADDWYWTSTEYSATSAWYLYLGNGYMYSYTKATDTDRVRPVSAFGIY